MKRLLIGLLLCALALTGCVTQRPEEHMLDGDGMEQPAPDVIPTDTENNDIPTDGEIAAIQPRLILDGSEPGEAFGTTIQVIDYQDGILTVQITEPLLSHSLEYNDHFTLSVERSGHWEPLIWPEDKLWQEKAYDDPGSRVHVIKCDTTDLGALDSGEYKLSMFLAEATFRLVWTE